MVGVDPPVFDENGEGNEEVKVVSTQFTNDVLGAIDEQAEREGLARAAVLRRSVDST